MHMFITRAFRRMKRSINMYFGFSAKEINGITILFVIIILTIFAPIVLQHYLVNNVTHTQDEAILQNWIKSIEEEKPSNLSLERVSVDLKTIQEFDPNDATLETFVGNGIPFKLANRIINYRSKGGKFRNKEDLKKIYGFSEKLYSKLSAKIFIKESFKDNKSVNNIKPNESINHSNNKPNYVKTFVYDINQLDTLQLEKFKGIGYKLASRIVKYRKALGGFVSIKQIQEVYGLNEETRIDLESKLTIDNNFIPKKINLNTSSYEELRNHPYIKGKLAAVILNYKKQHGLYKSIEDLKNIKILTEDDYLKLLPYLALE